MLSDEEKAIEELKNKEADYFMISNLTGKTLVNLIEKQSKEIEELKAYKHDAELTKITCCTAQNCEALNNCIKLERELQNADKKWEDKIKEICQKKRNQIFSCTYVDEKQWKPFDRAIDAINDLEQSLLEKE